MKANLPHLQRLADILADAQRIFGERTLAQHRKDVSSCSRALLHLASSSEGLERALSDCAPFLPPNPSMDAVVDLYNKTSPSTGRPLLSFFPQPTHRFLTFQVRIFTSLPRRDLFAAQALWNALHNIFRTDAHPPGAVRVELVMSQSYDAYIGNLTLAHVSLDSYPFSGCNSMQDLLWAGVPTVTLIHAPWDEEDAAFPIKKVDYNDDERWGWLDDDVYGNKTDPFYQVSPPPSPPSVGYPYIRETRLQRRLPVPVLWRSAIGGAMLARLGLHDLIARDPGEYHRKCVEMLINPTLRDSIRDIILSNPLSALSEGRNRGSGDEGWSQAKGHEEVIVTDQAAAAYPAIFTALHASLIDIMRNEGVEAAWGAAAQGRLLPSH